LFICSFSDGNNDFDFGATTESSNNIDDNTEGGGVASSQQPGNVLARGNLSSTLTSLSLELLALLFFVMLIQNW